MTVLHSCNTVVYVHVSTLSISISPNSQYWSGEFSVDELFHTKVKLKVCVQFAVLDVPYLRSYFVAKSSLGRLICTCGQKILDISLSASCWFLAVRYSIMCFVDYWKLGFNELEPAEENGRFGIWLPVGRTERTSIVMIVSQVQVLIVARSTPPTHIWDPEL